MSGCVVLYVVMLDRESHHVPILSAIEVMEWVAKYMLVYVFKSYASIIKEYTFWIESVEFFYGKKWGCLNVQCWKWDFSVF